VVDGPKRGCATKQTRRCLRRVDPEPSLVPLPFRRREARARAIRINAQGDQRYGSGAQKQSAKTNSESGFFPEGGIRPARGSDRGGRIKRTISRRCRVARVYAAGMEISGRDAGWCDGMAALRFGTITIPGDTRCRTPFGQTVAARDRFRSSSAASQQFGPRCGSAGPADNSRPVAAVPRA
jgi:hypothetical protein